MTMSYKEPLLEILNLNVCFEAPHLAPENLLRNVSFTLQKGGIHFLMGGNGSGKTSLLKTMIGLLPANTRIFDKNITLQPRGLVISGVNLPDYLKIGYIPQNPLEALVPSFNVAENISFRKFLRNNSGLIDWLIRQRYGKSLEDEVINAIGSFDITKKVLSDKIHHDITNLSGGEQQILNLASMIFDGCELIIMDEPTSKLDSKNRNDFWLFIEEIVKKNKCTMLIVTHDQLPENIISTPHKIFQIVSGVVIEKVPDK